jgi:hypothetical protein
MTRALVLVISLMFVGSCTDESSKKPILASPDAARTAWSAAPLTWRSELCRLAPGEDASHGAETTLTFRGECAFPQSAPVQCQAAADDFLVAAKRPLEGGRLFDFYVNVEQYHGPGNYDVVQTYVFVRDGQVEYRWANRQGSATVKAGPPMSVVFSNVRLEAVKGSPTSGSIVVDGEAPCVAAHW